MHLSVIMPLCSMRAFIAFLIDESGYQSAFMLVVVIGLAVIPQVSPLRFASVEMTNLALYFDRDDEFGVFLFVEMMNLGLYFGRDD